MEYIFVWRYPDGGGGGFDVVCPEGSGALYEIELEVQLSQPTTHQVQYTKAFRSQSRSAFDRFEFWET